MSRRNFLHIGRTVSATIRGKVIFLVESRSEGSGFDPRVGSRKNRSLLIRRIAMLGFFERPLLET
jgi:hypothetical protein